LAWLEEELPPPGPEDVLVETLASAVSVGTEKPLYRGDARSLTALTYPSMTGYESLGRVVSVGEGVEALGVGDRVLAFYGHRTAARLPAARVIPVPEDVPSEVALLAILSCDASKGIGKLRLDRKGAVLITGAGTLGLLALHRLRWLGFERVDVIEPLPRRRELARQLGARGSFAPEAFAPREPYTAGVECSSRIAAFTLLQRSLRQGGQICVLSDGNIEPLVLDSAFHALELTVVGSSDGKDYPGHARAFFERWRQEKAPLEELFEWRVRAEDLPTAFEKMLLEPPPIKVFVSYGAKR